MKTRAMNESHEWTITGEKINTSEKLQTIQKTMEIIGPIIVEHWHYCGGTAPDHQIFDDFELFETYLNENTYAGDAIHIWSFSEVCKENNELVHGKCPDEKGRVPKRGAY